MNIGEFKDLVIKHSVDQTDFFKMTALTGELGELANVIKKAEFYNMFKSYQKSVDEHIRNGIRKTFREQFVDEAGDTLFYYMALLNHWNVDISEVIDMQERKLNDQSKINGRLFKK